MIRSRAARRRALGAVILGALALAGCDLGTAPMTYAAPGGLQDVVDVDGDGHRDIVSASSTQWGVLHGDGSGGFAPVVTQDFEPCQPPNQDPVYIECDGRNLYFADADEDGDVDMFQAVYLHSSFPPPTENSRWTALQLRRNDGSGQFAAPVHVGDARVAANHSSPTASVGDATGDGVVDLVVVGVFTQPAAAIDVRVGDGSGQYGAPLRSALPGDMLQVAPRIADLDADGDSDLVFASTCFDGALRGCLDVMLGDGSGSFPSSTRHLAANPAVDGLGFGHSSVVDLDEDGDLDVVSGNIGSDTMDGEGLVGSYSIFYGDGTGAFAAEVSVPSYQQTSGIDAADFDGDGHLDLFLRTMDGDPLSTGTEGNGHIRFGDGTGSFTGDHVMPPGIDRAVDVDADGKADLVKTVPNGIQVFLNRWDGRPG